VPRIIVMADRPTDTVMLSERIGVADVDSEHCERSCWSACRGRSAMLTWPSKPTAGSEVPAPRCGPVERSGKFKGFLGQTRRRGVGICGQAAAVSDRHVSSTAV
jgi:hypothetical protein